VCPNGVEKPLLHARKNSVTLNPSPTTRKMKTRKAHNTVALSMFTSNFGHFGQIVVISFKIVEKLIR
jgi:hypothetical protein